VVLEQMAEANAQLCRHEFHQVGFDSVGISILCETEPLRQSQDVGIDADGVLPEGITENDICRLSTDAW
jgi:hypothetical protein